MSEPITVEYELDQRDWQGVTRSIEVDPEDYRYMSAEKIGNAIYSEIRRDAEQNLQLIYAKGYVAQKIIGLNAGKTECTECGDLFESSDATALCEDCREVDAFLGFAQ